MPLEGLWWVDDPSKFNMKDKEAWKWTAMIMQPDCVTNEIYLEAIEIMKKKKEKEIISRLRFKSFHEGMSAQIMHIGPFSEEGPTIERLHEFIEAKGYKISGKHHEIYLSDINRTASSKWKTIIRQPMKG
jgi:hypothetical protein